LRSTDNRKTAKKATTLKIGEYNGYLVFPTFLPTALKNNPACTAAETPSDVLIRPNTLKNPQPRGLW
jgi:hypothetical protein